MNGPQKVFFLDRDGVINIDHGYVCRIEDFEFIPDVFAVLNALLQKGYKLIVITNQSGIGRGYYTEETFEKLNEWMIQQLAQQGIKIEAVYSCPHAPEKKCLCRKPAPGLFLKAMEDCPVDLTQSWMLGDKETDMAAAEAAGIPNRALLGDAQSTHCTHRISRLSDLLNLPI